MIKTTTLKKGALMLGLALTLTTLQSQAQIIYTDIVPDGEPAGGGFDFNGDGTVDVFADSTGYLSYDWTEGGTNIWANGTETDGWDVAKPLTSDVVIGAAGNFIGGGDAGLDGWGAGSPFPPGEDRYVGFRLLLDGNVHYGWARVLWTGTGAIWKDYAYESTPGMALKAGEMPAPASVKNIAQTGGVQLYPMPAQGKVTLKNTGDQVLMQATILDISGKTIQTISLNGNNTQTLDIAHLSNGLYLLQVRAQNGAVSTQKLIVQ